MGLMHSYMNITIKAENYELSDGMRSLIHEKLGALTKFLGETALVAVKLGHKDKHQSGNNYYVQVNVDTGEKLYRATATAESLPAAVDQVEAELAAELARAKGKSRGLMRRTGAAMKAMFGR